MAEYHQLTSKRSKFLAILDEELRLAAAILPLKHASAISIQRVFRGTVVRSTVSKQSFAVGEIQRVFRGSLGRTKATNLVRNKQHKRHVSFLQYLCVQMQRCFRGYYSRKYKHDQHRRKLYCRMIEKRGEEVMEKMKQYSLEQAEQLDEDARQKRKKDFEALARNLHHLTSTRHIRGIYNPYINCLEAPTMNELPVEEHIRGVVKDLLRTRGITKRGLTMDIHGTMKIPLKGLKHRLSLQASSHYDALKEEGRKQQLHHKYALMSSSGFQAGGKTSIINNKDLPLAVGEPFMDQWANPLLVKGVPRDQQQLLESARMQKPLFATHIDKPFVSNVGGNRSTTLANDLFDVIADAQETGGAIQRHLGTGTARFGLAASCDARTSASISISANLLDTAPGPSISPQPPLRTSTTIRSTKTRLRTTQFTVKSKGRKSASAGAGVVGRLALAMAAATEETEEASSSDEEALRGDLPSPHRGFTAAMR